jgi:hypothetical protein
MWLRASRKVRVCGRTGHGVILGFAATGATVALEHFSLDLNRGGFPKACQ